ncbi:hypothetical protein CEXT_513671 [Caerostris extrusa]|uniref:Uncharacterized protein n=1 Tax=Caerostris extrusa TaxID=172846 RepID=A0AAV4WPE0_CAEEX|nr:hypothetical protein CEXT_513671 [Caerostris extrusa]
MKYRHRLLPRSANTKIMSGDPFVPKFAAVKAHLEAGATVSHIDADYDRANMNYYSFAIDVAISLTSLGWKFPLK